MPVPVSQMLRVARHVLGHQIAGRKRFPLVLMLEPLYRCNLACAGCGKIQYPSNVLKSHLSVEECMRAADEVDTPMVSITNFAIPGLGDEFGARVVFYDNRYAGTWDHGEYGGLMYGTISSTASN